MRAFGHHQDHMTHDAIVAFVIAAAAILFGFFFSAGVPITLTVAVDRVREPRKMRRKNARSRYPYR
jgi:hypothetical protein